jgi:HPt (histidine-containing phosphotransfer) domain-containing protein
MPDPILDYSALENLLATVGGDKAFLGEMIATFLSDSPKLIVAMQRALVSNNAEDFRRAAHTLKSNSANFGATNLSQMAKELEEMGKTGTLTAATEKIARVESEYARVKNALQETQTAG